MLPVLLIGFNRPEMIKSQLLLLSRLGVRKIYVAIDGGRNDSEQSICDLSAQFVNDFVFEGQLILKTRSHNLGCGLGVISALDWYFNLETIGIVLEDDCIPTSETFDFFENNADKLFKEVDLGMITAHNPCRNSSADIYSSYIFINGWMTSSEKYWQIRRNLFKISSPLRKNIPGPKWKLSDAIFWWATSTRVKLGAHDTWDSPFLENFSSLNYRCLVPKFNLIQNVGFGKFASHTIDENGSIFINDQAIPYEINQANFDSVVRDLHFRIRSRHSFTPLVKLLSSLLSRKRKDFEKILRCDSEYSI